MQKQKQRTSPGRGRECQLFGEEASETRQDVELWVPSEGTERPAVKGFRALRGRRGEIRYVNFHNVEGGLCLF